MCCDKRKPDHKGMFFFEAYLSDCKKGVGLVSFDISNRAPLKKLKMRRLLLLWLKQMW